MDGAPDENRFEGGKSPEEVDRIVKEIYVSAVYGIDTEAEKKREQEDEAQRERREEERCDEIYEAVMSRQEGAQVPEDDPVIAELESAQTYVPIHDRSTDRKKARKERRARRRREKKGGRMAVILSCALLIAGLYGIAVFSDIPFIKKWRDIYIETAMGTMTHQWLATAFIPDFVIDDVMGIRTGVEVDQDEIDTDWNAGSLSGADKKYKWSKLKKRFGDIYPEIDIKTLEKYMDKVGEDKVINDEGFLMIDEADTDADPTGIKTIYDDEVLAIDTVNGIVIIKVEGAEYEGRLAIVKEPSLVKLGICSDFGNTGAVIADIAQQNDAVLAMNASGFYDPGGHGNGGMPHGLVIKDGKTYSNFAGGNNKTIGFDYDDDLQIGKYRDSAKLRDAVEFKPVLVLDGKKVIEGSAGWGMQPRSAIGQTKDGQVLMLVVDGRQPGYSIGCTMGDLAEIMMRYGAYQACNLDGGSSSIMYYNGRKITRPSAGNKKDGRRIPDAFIVEKR